jgi:hypothetical protein
MLNQAFDDLQTAMDKVAEVLDGWGASRFMARDYEAATEAAARCQRLRDVTAKVVDWRESALGAMTAPVASPVRAKGMQGRSGAAGEGSSGKGRKGLRVTLSDGTVIQEPTTSATFALALKELGLERVARLGLESYGLPLVHRGHSEVYRVKAITTWTIDGYLVVTKMDSLQKKRYLDEAAERLSVKLQVDIPEGSTL